MTAIEDALDRFRTQPSPPDGVDSGPFKLVSTIEGPPEGDELQEAWGHAEIPADALALWSVCREARLFEDVEYGQWGVVLLPPTSSAARTATEHAARPSDLLPDDVVLGEFLGDQELVVLAPSEHGERRVLIALPLDSRDQWYGAATSLSDFLVKYFDAQGDKYWEQTGQVG